MHGRVIAEILCSSLSNAERVRDATVGLLTKTQAPTSFERLDPAIDGPDETGVWTLRFDVSYTSTVAAETLRDDVVGAWSSGAQANRILTGSRVSFHECRHDEGIGACVAVEAVK